MTSYNNALLPSGVFGPSATDRAQMYETWVKDETARRIGEAANSAILESLRAEREQSVRVGQVDRFVGMAAANNFLTQNLGWAFRTLEDANRLTPEEADEIRAGQITDAEERGVRLTGREEFRQASAGLVIQERYDQADAAEAAGNIEEATRLRLEAVGLVAASDARAADTARQIEEAATDVEEMANGERPLPEYNATYSALMFGLQTATSMPFELGKGIAAVVEQPMNLLNIGEDNAPSWAREWVQAMETSKERLFPQDAGRQGDFLMELASGVGSYAGFLLLHMAGVPVWASGAGTSGIAAMEDAERYGATALQKFGALVGGGTIGLSEAIPIDRLLMRMTRAGHGNMIMRVLSQSTASSIEEFTQELGQAFGEDVVARWIYDGEREFDIKAYLRQGAVGLITGFAGGAVGGAYGPPTAAQAEAGANQEQLATAIEAVIAEAQTRIDAIVVSDDAATVDGVELDLDQARDDVRLEMLGEWETQLEQGEEASFAGISLQEDGVAREAAFQEGVEAALIGDAAAPPQVAPELTAIADMAHSVTIERLDARVNNTPAQLDAITVAELGSTQTNVESENFKAWFGDSKIVDESGAPMVVYHGSTEQGIRAFDTSRVTERGKGDQAGTYFTGDATAAQGYTRPRIGQPRVAGQRGSVTAAYLNMRNPLNTTAAIAANRKSGMSFGDAKRAALEELDRTVHDGIVFDGDDMNPSEYVVFDPTQIKSVNNSGAFDGNDPDILGQNGVPLFDNPLTIDGKVTIKKIGQALTDDHMDKVGRQLFPEDNAADYDTVLNDMINELAVQLLQPASGVGWYSKDVDLAVANTAQMHPEIATPEGRAVWLTLAGIFSNGTDPSNAWSMSSGAFAYWAKTGEIPTVRADAERALTGEATQTSFKDKDGEQINKDAGWGIRGAANTTQLAMFKYLVEREGGPVEAVAWLRTEQERTAINEVVQTAQKAPRFKTVAEKNGPPAWGALMLGDKLGRYTLGLQGHEISADDTTVDLWYTRTYRRLTGRLMEAPLGKEGVAAQPSPNNGGIERKTIFRLTSDLADKFDLGPSDIQAALWFFEKRLWGAQGVNVNEGTNSAGAKRLLEANGFTFDDGARSADTGGSPAAEVDGADAADRGAVDDGGTGRSEDTGEVAQDGELVRRLAGLAGSPRVATHVEFSAAMQAAGSTLGPVAAQVSTVPEDSTAQRILLDDGATGVALDGDNIIGVFASATSPKGAGGRAIAAAVAAGGRRLDGFNTYLPKIYEKGGFKAVARLAFNAEFAPSVEGGALADWDAAAMEAEGKGWGTPDVTFMVYDPANASKDTDVVVTEYDDGIAAQNAALAEFDAATGTSSTRAPYIGEQTRPDAGIPSNPNATVEDTKLSQIAKNFTKMLNLTVRQGRFTLKGQNIMGQYSRKTSVVRLRTWDDLSTLVHEGGHALHDAMDGPLANFVKRYRGDILKASEMYATDISREPIAMRTREGFAEFFRIFVLNRKYAETKFPQLTKDFAALLDSADPALAQGMGAIGDQFAAWAQQPSLNFVRSMISPAGQVTGIKAAVEELMDVGAVDWSRHYMTKAVASSVNSFAPLNRMVADMLNKAEANRGEVLDLKVADDPRKMITLARNSSSRAMVQLTSGVIPYHEVTSATRSLQDALYISQGHRNGRMGKFNETRELDFNAYLVARRAEDEYRRLAENKIKRPPVQAKLGEIQQSIKELEAKYGRDFTEAAEIVNEYAEALWEKQRQAGLLTAEAYKEGLDRNFYVPLQRDMSGRGGALGTASSAMRGGKTPMFKGSDRDILMPLSVLMHKTFSVEQSIAQNDLVKALAKLADDAGTAGALVERVPSTKMVGKQVSVVDIAKNITGMDDISVTEAADLMAILGPHMEKDKMLSFFRSEQASAAGENILFYFNDGKVEAIQLVDNEIGNDVAELMDTVGRENMGWLFEGISMTSSVFRIGITSWPDFIVVNFMRDQLQAWLSTDVGFKPFVSGAGGVYDEITSGKWAKEYNAAMGLMGGINNAAMHGARVERDIQSLKGKGFMAKAFREGGFAGAAKGMASFVEISETGTRVGLYKNAVLRAKADGLSDWEAAMEGAYIATDYMNYGMNGGNAMLVARRTIPFLNAQIQGLYKMARVLGNNEDAQRKGLTFALTSFLKSTNGVAL